MSGLLRQHLISASIVTAMLIWLGAASASTCKPNGMNWQRAGLLPAEIAPPAMMAHDEHEDDRYLNWSSGGGTRLPPHLAMPGGSSEME